MKYHQIILVVILVVLFLLFVYGIYSLLKRESYTQDKDTLSKVYINANRDNKYYDIIALASGYTISPSYCNKTITVESDIGENRSYLQIYCNRNNNTDSANIFAAAVKGMTNPVVFCTNQSGKSDLPSELNFVINGTITLQHLGSDSFNINICVGQGHSGAVNNWWLATENITGTVSISSTNDYSFTINFDPTK